VYNKPNGCSATGALAQGPESAATTTTTSERCIFQRKKERKKERKNYSIIGEKVSSS
jgi:hypothetical protein